MLEKLRNPAAILIAVAVLIAAGAGFATGAKLINSDDVKNNSLTGQDIKDNSVTSKEAKNNNLQSADVKDGTLNSADVKNNNLQSGDVKDGTLTSADVKNGTLTESDLSAATIEALMATYSGPHWSIVDRNVIGSGDSYLRAGPSVVALPGFPEAIPPEGIGSLGIRTRSPEDKAAFGNQMEFADTPLTDVVTVSYWVFTTAENIGQAPIGVPNMPSAAFELSIDQGTPLPEFSTLVFIPQTNTLPGQWKLVDASVETGWGLTGFPNDECGINGPKCTLQGVKDLLASRGETAVIGSVLIQKGRDFAFSGAVDALTLNDATYDFEPFGVSEVAP